MAGMAGFGGFGGGVQALIRVGADFRGLQASTAKAMATMQAQMKAGTAGLATATAETKRLNQQLGHTQANAVKAGKAIKILALGLGALGIGFAAMAIKSAISFESAFAGVEKTVDGTVEQMEELRRQFRELAKEIPTSANELATIGESAGALGIARENILEFTKVVATLAQTTDVSSEQAATALGQLSNVLKLTEEDYSRFAATLVDLGNKGASTESQILQMASRAGGSAKLIGLSTSSILAMSSAVANLGIRVEAGGSSLQKFFLELNKTVGAGSVAAGIAKGVGTSVNQIRRDVEKGGKALDNLAKKAGMSGTEIKKAITSLKGLELISSITGVTEKKFAKLFNRDAEKAIVLLMEGLSKLGKTARQSALADLGFDDIRITRMLLGMADNVDMLKFSLETGRTAWEENTAATEEAEKRYGTTASKMGKVRNAITDMFISVGDAGLDPLKDFLDLLVVGLPNAFQALGALWKDSLEKPFISLTESAFALLDVIMDIFLTWGGSKGGDSMVSGMEHLGNAAAFLVDTLTALLDTFRAILANPIVNQLAKVGVIMAGIAVAAKVIGGIRGIFSGIGGGVAAKIGLGGFLPGAGGADNIDMKAASTQMAAAEMQMVAAKSTVAGGVGRALAGSGFGGAGGLQMMPRTPQQGVGMAFARNQAGQIGQIGQSVPAQATALQKIKFAGVGRGLVRGAAGSIAQGARAAMSGGARLLRGGLGVISKVFWPAFIGMMVAEIAAAPIGDMLKKTKGFERVGEAFEKGFFPGLLAGLEAFQKGTDAFVNRDEAVFQFGAEGSTGEGLLDRDAVENLAHMFDEVKIVRAMMDDIEEAITEGRNPAFAQQKLLDWAGEKVPNMFKALDAFTEAVDENLIPRDIALQGSPFGIGTTDKGFKLFGEEGQVGKELTENIHGTLDTYTELAESLGIDIPKDIKELNDMMGGSAGVRAFDFLNDNRDFFQKHRAFFEEVEARFDGDIRNASESLTLLLMQAIGEIGLKVDMNALQGLTGNLDAQSDLFELFKTDVPKWLMQFKLSEATGVETGQKAAIVNPSAGLGVQLKSLDEYSDRLDTFVQNQKDNPLIGEFGFQAARDWLDRYAAEFEKVDPKSQRARFKFAKRAASDLFAEGGAFEGFTLGKKVDKKESATVDEIFGIVEQRKADIGKLAGSDQLEARAEAAQEVLMEALSRGLSEKDFDLFWEDLWPNLIDGIGEPEDDVAERAGDAVANFVSDAIKPSKKGGINKLKGSDRKALRQQVVGMIKNLLGEDAFTDEKTGEPLVGGFRAAIVGSMMKEFEEADSTEDKNNLQEELKKLFPKKIQNWDDVVAMMESPSAEQWAEKFEDIGDVAETEGTTELGDTSDSIIAALADPIINFIPPDLATKVKKMVTDVTAGVNLVLPALSSVIDKIIAEIARADAAEKKANKLADKYGQGRGPTGEPPETPETPAQRRRRLEEENVTGATGQSFGSNVEAFQQQLSGAADVGGGGGLSFGGNAAAFTAAAQPQLPGDFGGDNNVGQSIDGDQTIAEATQPSSEQNIYVQNMSVIGEPEEQSILYQLAFMAPGDGGGA